MASHHLVSDTSRAREPRRRGGLPRPGRRWARPGRGPRGRHRRPGRRRGADAGPRRACRPAPLPHTRRLTACSRCSRPARSALSISASAARTSALNNSRNSYRMASDGSALCIWSLLRAHSLGATPVGARSEGTIFRSPRHRMPHPPTGIKVTDEEMATICLQWDAFQGAYSSQEAWPYVRGGKRGLKCGS